MVGLAAQMVGEECHQERSPTVAPGHSAKKAYRLLVPLPAVLLHLRIMSWY